MRKKKTSPKHFCFVLMPFTEELANVYEFGIKGACEDNGDVYCERVDEQVYSEPILDRIYGQISKADIIIADMTGKNANVFYEVGYAHALDKPVILIANSKNDIPFDLSAYFHIIYGNNISHLRAKLSERITWHIEEHVVSKSETQNDLSLLINGEQLKCDVQASENPRFRVDLGINLTIVNVSNRVLSYKDYSITLLTSSVMHVDDGQGGRPKTPIVLSSDRFQFSFDDGPEVLFPGQTFAMTCVVLPSNRHQGPCEFCFRIYSASHAMDYRFVGMFDGKTADDVSVQLL